MRLDSPLRVLLVLGAILLLGTDGRGGRRGGKGKGKSNLQFSHVAEFSLVQTIVTDNRSAQIITGSHFSQTFRLGYKLLMICKGRGEPRPTIKWFKEGSEIPRKPSVHQSSVPIDEDAVWSKLEIDPATMGDQGIYSCIANNAFGVMAKNFKAEYTY